MFLIIHILGGCICLLTGILAGLSKKQKGKHTIFGEIYHASYAIVFLTAVIMAILHWKESSYLFYIAIFSYLLALIGYLAAKFKKRSWLKKHIIGMMGSYIGIVTATLVVNVSKIPILNNLPTLLVWFLPTIIGTPIIVMVRRKYVPKGQKAADKKVNS